VHSEELGFAFGLAVEAVVSAVEGDVLTDVGLDVVEGVFAWFLGDGLLVDESFDGGPEELEGEGFLLQGEGGGVVVVLARCRLFRFEDVFGTLLDG
jgi:hypothetical protein